MATTATKQPKSAPKGTAKPDDENAEDAAPVKKPRSLFKILLLLTPLVLAGAGGGTWFLMQGEEPAAPVKRGPAKAAAKAKHDPAKPPVFVTLDPFVVNLQQSDMPSQYLQVGLVLKVQDEDVVDPIKLHMPEIRNRVLLLLSGKSANELATSEGKKALSTELAHEIQQPLKGSVAAKAIDSVLFTSFVIQ